jgi:hypothetical protein
LIKVCLLKTMTKGLRLLVQLMLANRQEGPTTGLVHPDHQVVWDKDPDETETIVVLLLDPPSPHPGKRNSLVGARN